MSASNGIAKELTREDVMMRAFVDVSKKSHEAEIAKLKDEHARELSEINDKIAALQADTRKVEVVTPTVVNGRNVLLAKAFDRMTDAIEQTGPDVKVDVDVTPIAREVGREVGQAFERIGKIIEQNNIALGASLKPEPLDLTPLMEEVAKLGVMLSAAATDQANLSSGHVESVRECVKMFRAHSTAAQESVKLSASSESKTLDALKDVVESVGKSNADVKKCLEKIGDAVAGAMNKLAEVVGHLANAKPAKKAKPKKLKMKFLPDEGRGEVVEVEESE